MKLYRRSLPALVICLALLSQAAQCDQPHLVKLADRASNSSLKFKPIFQSLCDNGNAAACLTVKRIDQFSADTKLLADALRNGTGDALGLASSAIGFLETLINQDAQLIKDPNTRTLALSFLAIADVALGEIADALSTSATAHPVIANNAKAANPAATATIAAFAKKPRLRCRDAKSGRFEKMEVCQAHPDTTVVERVK